MMATKHNIYWYRESAFVANAFLYNCRDNDLQPRSGARIKIGEIVSGVGGYVAAEQIVPGFNASVVPFAANRRCEWHGLDLPSMVHSTHSRVAFKSSPSRLIRRSAIPPPEKSVKLAQQLGLQFGKTRADASWELGIGQFSSDKVLGIPQSEMH